MNAFRNEIKSNFTALPNILANDPNLSWKAKGIFLYLASKPDTWNFYMKEIQKNATDGIVSLKSGIKELIKHGYLKRKRLYKDGKIRGMKWTLLLPAKTYRTENLSDRDPIRQESRPHSNTDNSNTDCSNNDIVASDRKEGSKPSIGERNKKCIPLSTHLAKTVKSYRNYKIDKKKIKSWANDFRLLKEKDGVDSQRIKKVLTWYRKNIGGQYVPEAFSASTFRSKFLKLESALERQKNPPKNGQAKKTTIGYSENHFQNKNLQEEEY